MLSIIGQACMCACVRARARTDAAPLPPLSKKTQTLTIARRRPVLRHVDATGGVVRARQLEAVAGLQRRRVGRDRHPTLFLFLFFVYWCDD